MKKHVKIYMDYFDYGIEDFIPCEVCGSKAVDIHHIENRGMGGSKQKDVIEYLQALCRKCHIEFGDKEKHKNYLTEIHKKRLKSDVFD
jgi:hypothetical protein